jgi:hypothetical protein
MPCSWAWDELALADYQGIKHQQSFVILGHGPYQVSQELEGMGVLFQALDCGWCGIAAATEHSRLDEEKRNEGVACGNRHGQRPPADGLRQRGYCGGMVNTG